MNDSETKPQLSKRHIFALDIFKREGNSSIIVFLCGKKLSETSSVRAKLNIELRKYEKIKIAFPEFLFSDERIFADDDLLDLEKKLAKWVDIVVIPIESPSTYVELGAFCALPELLPKVLVLNEAKYKRDKKSFISLGPLKAIRKNNEANIVYYRQETIDQDLSALAESLSRRIYKKVPHDDLENIFNLSRLIRSIIAIWQPITKKQLLIVAKEIFNGCDAKLLQACLDHLIQSLQIKRNTTDTKQLYSLSPTGFREYITIVETCRSLRKHTESRAQTLRSTYINRKVFRGGGARKFLDFDSQ